MATNMSSNKLVWVLVGVLALVVGVAVVNSGNQTKSQDSAAASTAAQSGSGNGSSSTKQNKADDKTQKQAAQSHPKSGKDDGDTVTETLKEVKARYETAQDENDKLKKNQDELLRRLNALESKANKPVQESGGSVSSDPRVQDFMSRLESAEKNLGNLANNVVKGIDEKLPANGTHHSNGYEISNNDLGWGDNSSAGDANKSKKGLSIGPQAMPGYALVQPMTRSQLLSTDPKLAEKMLREKLQGVEGGLTEGKSSIEKSQLTNTLKKSAGGKLEPEVNQYRTIPRRATGFEAVAMTAMIGTVPVGGKIQDPFPVKLILGDDNYSSNGMGIPGLKGIVIDGIARGNWNLSCVAVTLTGATFTFADGRVQPMEFNREQGKESGGSGDSKNATVSPFAENEGSRGIGYISNPQGVPCIPGKRITDAHKQLFTLGLLGAGKSYFDAKASAETTSTRNPLGGSSTDVTGDKAAFINNATYANTVDTAIDFYNKRMRDTFDVIYAEPNQKVMVHFTQDLYVDYHSNQRKLTYASGGKNGHSMD